MSNAAVTADAFGMTQADVDKVADTVATPDEVGSASGAPKKKAGIPVYAWVGIGVAALVFGGVILMIFINIAGRNSAQTVRKMPAPEMATENANLGVMRTEIAGLKAAIQALQDDNKQLNGQIQQAARAADTRPLERRVELAEGSLQKMGVSISAIGKRVADNKPFDSELYSREDARIASIGSGVARITERGGREVVLRKGDRWDGLIVRDIRADRGTVLLSDGTVIR